MTPDIEFEDGNVEGGDVEGGDVEGDVEDVDVEGVGLAGLGFGAGDGHLADAGELLVAVEPTAFGAVAYRVTSRVTSHVRGPVAGAVRAVAAAGAERAAAGWAPPSEPVREVPSAITTHYVLGPPDELVSAVERFLDHRRGRVSTRWGTLRLARRQADRPMPAAWAGTMRLRISPAAITVELDVEQWRSIGLMITLRPVRARDRRIGAHRRWAWFRAGHDALEQLRLAVEQPRASPSGVAAAGDVMA